MVLEKLSWLHSMVGAFCNYMVERQGRWEELIILLVRLLSFSMYFCNWLHIDFVGWGHFYCLSENGVTNWRFLFCNWVVCRMSRFLLLSVHYLLFCFVHDYMVEKKFFFLVVLVFFSKWLRLSVCVISSLTLKIRHYVFR